MMGLGLAWTEGVGAPMNTENVDVNWRRFMWGRVGVFLLVRTNNLEYVWRARVEESRMRFTKFIVDVSGMGRRVLSTRTE